MTFGYNAAAAFGNSMSDFEDHAKDLLSSLVDKRQTNDVSPCLSAHSSETADLLMVAIRRYGGLLYSWPIRWAALL